MLSTIIRYATTRPKRVIAVWLLAGIAFTLLGSFKSYRVTTDDTARFLPKASESAQALRYARDAFGVRPGTTTASVLVRRADGAPLTARDRAAVKALATTTMAGWRPDHHALVSAADGIDLDIDDRAGGLVAAAPGPLARDGRFQLVGVQWKANTTDPVAQAAFRQFRDHLADQARARHLTVAATGGIADAADLADATKTSQAVSSALLLSAVLLLSLLFFRGPLAAIVPLLAISLVGGTAAGLIVAAALVFGFALDQSTPQLITVVLVGVGIDYFLFLLFRLRERLRAGEDRRTAALSAAGRVGPVIASAALAVVAAFATLGLARFGQFRVLGPSIAISVLVMLLAGVTLMPAIAATTGRALFWPSKRWAEEREDGPAARLGLAIARQPGRIALAVTLVLVALATAALGAKMDYNLTGGGPSTPATRAADAIAAQLPEGTGDPQQVYVRSQAPLTAAALEPMRRRIAATPGVGSVGAPALTADRHGARIDVALDAESTSAKGMAVARGPLRTAAHDAAPPGATALVAGNAAVFADVSDAVDRDLRVVFPVAAALILLILVVTLRSVLAPLYLLAAVALEFAATLGAAVLVFQVVGGTGGVAFTLPLVLFLFVVALGTDYNILMTARLREELLAGRPVREAVADAVRHVAPAVAAAGLVLASSFATLMLEADESARQMGFAMAAGILLASLVVSSVLVPALTALVGRRAFTRPGRPRGSRSSGPSRLRASARRPRPTVRNG